MNYEKNYENNPTKDITKDCPNCGEKLFMKDMEWLHWETAEVYCSNDWDEIEEAWMDPEPISLFETLGEILKPESCN